MRRISQWKIGIMLLLVLVMLQGCGMLTSQRTGADWLDLVHAGIIAEDDFRFDGSVVMGVRGGVELSPYSFEGEILGHKQVALHVEQSNSLVRNPVQDLDFLEANYQDAEVLYKGLDDNGENKIVVLQVTVKPEAATARWKEQLKQELSNVTLQAITTAETNNRNIKLVKQEASTASTALDQLLEKLKVSMTYTIAIDSLRAKPLKMDENVEMQYEKGGSMLNEYRKTNIKFDLDGSKKR